MRQFKITTSITDNDQILSKYLKEISKVPLLTIDEEVELIKRIKKGDEQANNELIKANLRFVVSVAKKYQNHGISVVDLVNEGNIGLIIAAKRFDETKGFKFISYAIWWIRHTIILAIVHKSKLVRIPGNRTGALNELKLQLNKLEHNLQREPFIQEIAEILDIGVSQAEEIINSAEQHLVLDESINELNENKFLEILACSEDSPDYELNNEGLKKEIASALNILPQKHAQILKFYFGIGMEYAMSLQHIADYYGVTIENIRQIKNKSLEAIRNSHKSNILKTYLDK